MIPLRLARELTYQLDKAGEHERLARALANVPVFLVLNKGEGQSDYLILWQKLSAKAVESEPYFRTSLAGLRSSGSSLLPDALSAAGGFFVTRCADETATEFCTELLVWAEARNDETRAMKMHRGIGIVLDRTRDYDAAMTHFAESLRLAESLGDKSGIALAIGSMGLAHEEQHRYAEAMECYERQLTMAQALGDKSQIADATINMGSVHSYQGRNVEAMECFERGLAIAESIGHKKWMSNALICMGNLHFEQGRHVEAMVCFERTLAMDEALGDKRGVAGAINCMGFVHLSQGRYAEAMECFERSLAMDKTLGDKRGMANIITCMGIVHHSQGRYTEAKECFGRSLAMGEAIGDKHGMAAAVGNMGDVHLNQGRYAEALQKYREALDGHRAIGVLNGMTYWHDGIARTLLETADSLSPDERIVSLREARENAQECVRISEEIGNPDMLFLGRITLARLDAAEGNAALATEKLETMLAEATDEEHIADLHYWLWKINSGMGTRSPEPILKMYEALYARIPKFEFLKRIAELKGERVPMSADDLEIPPPFQGGGQGVVA